MKGKEQGRPDVVVFLCKDCRELVDVKQVGRKFVYRCKKCNTKNVAFGTEKTILDFYHVKNSPLNKDEKKPEPAADKPKEKK